MGSKHRFSIFFDRRSRTPVLKGLFLCPPYLMSMYSTSPEMSLPASGAACAACAACAAAAAAAAPCCVLQMLDTSPEVRAAARASSELDWQTRVPSRVMRMAP